LKTTSDGKSIKIKVVALQKLFNFVVDNCFVWICLRPETINLHSVSYNMWPTKLQSRHEVSDMWSDRRGEST
jgi:hypothetical protein